MVHYYFITEGPELNDDEPPFPFLGSIFPRDDDRIKVGSRFKRSNQVMGSRSLTGHVRDSICTLADQLSQSP